MRRVYECNPVCQRDVRLGPGLRWQSTPHVCQRDVRLDRVLRWQKVVSAQDLERVASR